jgi:hypothetical protein
MFWNNHGVGTSAKYARSCFWGAEAVATSVLIAQKRADVAYVARVGNLIIDDFRFIVHTSLIKGIYATA